MFYDCQKPFATLHQPSKSVDHSNSSKHVEFSISPKKAPTKLALAKRPSFTSYVDENDEIDGTVELRKSVKVPIQLTQSTLINCSRTIVKLQKKLRNLRMHRLRKSVKVPIQLTHSTLVNYSRTVVNLHLD